MSTGDEGTGSARRWDDRREVVRLIAGIVVILAFIALAALAIAASRSDLSISAPASASQPVAAPQLPDVPTPHALGVPAVPLLSAAGPRPAPPAPPAAAGTPVAAPAAVPPLPEPAVTGVPCPQLGLPAPAEVGGVQSLVRLIPVFGPFAPEAFAFLPALQPGIDALGPLFPVFADGLDGLAPVLDGAVPLAQQLGEAGYGVLAPLYGPVREDVLAGERALAAYLEPIVASLAEAPGSECLVALEGVLASLRPGLQ